MKLTTELMEKAQTAKTPEELILLAKTEGLAITLKDATLCFANLHPQSGELADNELENVSGGGCKKPQKTLVNANDSCSSFVCKACGDSIEGHKINCHDSPYYCSLCKKSSYEGGLWFCSNT